MMAECTNVSFDPKSLERLGQAFRRLGESVEKAKKSVDELIQATEKLRKEGVYCAEN